MKFKIGDIVIIDNYGGEYHCLIGEIIEFDEKTEFYTVDTKLHILYVKEKLLKLNK